MIVAPLPGGSRCRSPRGMLPGKLLATIFCAGCGVPGDEVSVRPKSEPTSPELDWSCPVAFEFAGEGVSPANSSVRLRSELPRMVKCTSLTIWGTTFPSLTFRERFFVGSDHMGLVMGNSLSQMRSPSILGETCSSQARGGIVSRSGSPMEQKSNTSEAAVFDYPREV